ncbi:MAG: (2Fe-2S)-binding protein [Oscillospiraceae bacterium]|jgi:predicted molibdopterin-dependent oxidoreductase YjgC|nr:(2Fe-2S)-binding protein [Oscillospiraceae bacterium]
MRIDEHPVLGAAPERREVKFTHDGAELTGYDGEPIAAALRAAGVMIHRYTKKYDSPRGVFCAIGRCTDCVMTVDGVSNVRTCVTALREGMAVDTQRGAGRPPERGTA